MKFYRNVLFFLSKKLNSLIGLTNPFAASLSKAHSYSKNPIRNWKRDCLVDEKTKISEPYKLSDVKIGAYTYIAENSRISIANIGKFCSIGPNFLCGWGIHPTQGISTSPMFYSTLLQNGYSLSKENKIAERKNIIIGNDVFIGMNVTVIDGVTIGDGAVIGAGAVVHKDIPPYAIAVGCPIRIVNYRFEEEVIAKLLKMKWWDWPYENLLYVEENFFNMKNFVAKYYDDS